MARRKQRKQIKVELISREENGKVRQPYAIMDELIGSHHPHLAEAKIALAWNSGWSEDADGHMKLGQAKKASDLDRELHEFDFIILLNYQIWNRVEFTREQMRALLDHELCHCDIATDENDEEKRDDKGRPVWRIRKHDIEEFHEIVARHGAWKTDLERFIRTALASGDATLFADNK